MCCLIQYILKRNYVLSQSNIDAQKEQNKQIIVGVISKLRNVFNYSFEILKQKKNFNYFSIFKKET